MKKIILSGFLVYSFPIFAQKNFEGKITYASYSPDDTSVRKNMVVYLKGDKMLIDGGEETKDSKSLHSLYDFGKGVSYSFSIDSIALYTKLTKNIFPYSGSESDSTTICGYLCYKKPGFDYPSHEQLF
jgi:hypothetical protein